MAIAAKKWAVFGCLGGGAIGLASPLVAAIVWVRFVFAGAAHMEVEPSEKARVLAQGISEAMNVGALLVVVCVPLGAIVGVLVARRRARRMRPPEG